MRGDASDELDGGKKNPNSAKVWHFGGATTPADRAKLKRNYYFGRTMSTASIHEDLCYVAELDGTVHCLDANTGQAYWSHDTGNMSWCATYWADGKVYFGNDGGRLTVFKHGKKKQLVNTIDMNCGYIRATPVAVDGVLYVMTENPTQLWAIVDKGGK